MNCLICNNSDIEVTYEGYIRDGKVGSRTKKKMPIYKCKKCFAIWHDDLGMDYKEYYQSEMYREHVNGTSDIEDFYTIHDSLCMEKFIQTGTEIFRNKIVADIGCGGGSFLNYISTVAKEIIAIEPSKKYQEELKRRGYKVYSYASEALEDYANSIDIVISFDVIEHVNNPVEFVLESKKLLKKEGRAIIGTPTESPIMRKMLLDTYDEFLFCTQHLWVLGKESFKEITKICGITKYDIKYYQRYGIGNFISWLVNKEPRGNITYDFISKTLDNVWKIELEHQELADYIILDYEK